MTRKYFLRALSFPTFGSVSGTKNDDYRDSLVLPLANPFCVSGQIYLGVERGGASKRATPQVLFLRAISHRPETYTIEGANQVGMGGSGVGRRGVPVSFACRFPFRIRTFSL